MSDGVEDDSPRNAAISLEETDDISGEYRFNFAIAKF